MNIERARSIAEILNGNRYSLSRIPPKGVLHGCFSNVLFFPISVGTIWGTFNGDFVSTGECLQQNNDG